jgi:hypothetical protein
MEQWKREIDFTKNVSLLIQHIFSKGYVCSISEEWMKTAHHPEKMLFIEINLFSVEGKVFEDVEMYEPFGRYWESLGELNRWGGKYPRSNVNNFSTIREWTHERA